MKNLLFVIFVLFIAFLINAPVQAQTSSVFVAGLKSPQKIIYDHHHRLFFVSEVGEPNVANSGRISMINNEGERFTLIDGLPSGAAPPSGEPSGVSALWIQGHKLYIAIGNGNSTIAGPAPGSEIPNPNPNSPLFSAVLEFRFPVFGFRPNRANYRLTINDHQRLVNGETVFFGGLGLPRPRIKMLADFPNFTPNPRPDVPNNVRPSNLFGLAQSGGTLYVADASQNNISTVDLEDGSVGTLINYPARMNPTPVGPPFVEAVPDSLRLYGNKLLITFLTGFPFAAGLADVRAYDLESGTDSQVIGGLTSAIDVLAVNEGGFCTSFYTLEFSTNMLMNAPGRLRRYDSPTAQPTLIADTLISPTSMARHPASGDLLVTEIFTGRIMRIGGLLTN